MTERPRPELDKVRDALREHDERVEEPVEPDPEPPNDEDDDEAST